MPQSKPALFIKRIAAFSYKFLFFCVKGLTPTTAKPTKFIFHSLEFASLRRHLKFQVCANYLGSYLDIKDLVI